MPIYTQLDPRLRQIRLLRVLPNAREPGLQSPLLHCELTIHNLDADNPPQYTALSYVWGLPPPQCPQPSSTSTTLMVNGQPILARSNLLHALRSFRDRRDEGHLWVDAVCINQGDMAEKGVQIALMGDVYSLAARTIIWLGPADGDSDEGMDFVARVTAEDLEEDHFAQNTGNLKAVMHLMHRSWCKTCKLQGHLSPEFRTNCHVFYQGPVFGSCKKPFSQSTPSQGAAAETYPSSASSH